VGHLQFPAMQVAEIEIRGGVDLELRAIDWYYRTWLPTSGYVPTDQPAIEAFLGRPFAYGEKYFELRAQFPVMRA
jgi:AraC family transcriptional regulator